GAEAGAQSPSLGPRRRRIRDCWTASMGLLRLIARFRHRMDAGAKFASCGSEPNSGAGEFGWRSGQPGFDSLKRSWGADSPQVGREQQLPGDDFFVKVPLTFLP